ncbi:unnamed protein product [Durusdinium trenchii]|uniref:EGF-like domain-containing protein n=1 Tax=Durusdinium trenchii TaxID=1381693 RepID=A0ABP0HHR7_9DINO
MSTEALVSGPRDVGRCNPLANASKNLLLSDCIHGVCTQEGICECEPGWEHDQVLFRFFKCSLNSDLRSVGFALTIGFQVAGFLFCLPFLVRMRRNKAMGSKYLRRAAVYAVICWGFAFAGSVSVVVRGRQSPVGLWLIVTGAVTCMAVVINLLLNLFVPLEQQSALLDKDGAFSSKHPALAFLIRSKSFIAKWFVLIYGFLAQSLCLSMIVTPFDDSYTFNRFVEAQLSLLVAATIIGFTMSSVLVDAVILLLKTILANMSNEGSDKDRMLDFYGRMNRTRRLNFFYSATTVLGCGLPVILFEFFGFMPFCGLMSMVNVCIGPQMLFFVRLLTSNGKTAKAKNYVHKAWMSTEALVSGPSEVGRCNPLANASKNLLLSDCIHGVCTEEGVCECESGWEHDQLLFHFFKCSLNSEVRRVVFAVSIGFQVAGFLHCLPFLVRMWREKAMGSRHLRRATVYAVICWVCALGATLFIVVQGRQGPIGLWLILTSGALCMAVVINMLLNFFVPLEQQSTLLDKEGAFSSKHPALAFLIRSKSFIAKWFVLIYGFLAQSLSLSMIVTPFDDPYTFNRFVEAQLCLLVTATIMGFAMSLVLVDAFLKLLTTIISNMSNGGSEEKNRILNLHGRLTRMRRLSLLITASTLLSCGLPVILFEFFGFMPFGGLMSIANVCVAPQMLFVVRLLVSDGENRQTAKYKVAPST